MPGVSRCHRPAPTAGPARGRQPAGGMALHRDRRPRDAGRGCSRRRYLVRRRLCGPRPRADRHFANKPPYTVARCRGRDAPARGVSGPSGGGVPARDAAGDATSAQATTATSRTRPYTTWHGAAAPASAGRVPAVAGGGGRARRTARDAVPAWAMIRASRTGPYTTWHGAKVDALTNQVPAVAGGGVPARGAMGDAVPAWAIIRASRTRPGTTWHGAARVRRPAGCQPWPVAACLPGARWATRCQPGR